MSGGEGSHSTHIDNGGNKLLVGVFASMSYRVQYEYRGIGESRMVLTALTYTTVFCLCAVCVSTAQYIES